MNKIYKAIIITSIIWIMVVFGLEVFHSGRDTELFNKGIEMGRDWTEKDILYSNKFNFLNNFTCTSVPCSEGHYCYTLNCTEVLI